MNRLLSLSLAPLLVLTTACSTHYAASSHHGYRGHSHGGVSVGVSGHGHGGEILGALIVGGIIGHALTEAAAEQKNYRETRESNASDDSQAVVNGYPVNQKVQAQANQEQSKWYQLGQDGHCYLMELVDGKSQVISAVPKYSCN